MRGKWFIALREVEMSHQILAKILEGSSGADATVLSDRKPFTFQIDDRKEMKSMQKFSSDLPDDSVAVIPVHGSMIKYGTYCAYGTTEIADTIYEAANNDKISGIVLDIDSGGGCVDAIAPLTAALEYNRSRGKSSVAFCDLAASAAYYAAVFCDKIVAANTISAEFGSIGVMMSFPDYAKYYENVGIKVHTIYSNLSEYKNAPFEAAKEGKYDLIKAEELDPLAKAFQETVKSRRSNLDLSIQGIVSGKMFYAEDALKFGLIDSIGNKQSAINQVRELRREAVVKDYINNIK